MGLRVNARHHTATAISHPDGVLRDSKKQRIPPKTDHGFLLTALGINAGHCTAVIIGRPDRIKAEGNAHRILTGREFPQYERAHGID